MSAFLKGLAKFFQSLLELLKLLPTLITELGSFLKSLWRALRHCFHRPSRDKCCYDLPGVYKRPDPMIYSQYWLMKQGLAVSWDNPDIQLYDTTGNPASPSDLNPDQDYKVVVRCWNNSYGAGVPNLPVYLSYLSFGVGVTSTPIPPPNSTTLGVKGSATCPAFVSYIWHTPSMPGHYCLQAQLVCADDANPDNNLGQKNVHVGKLASPAMFGFAVQNQASVRRRFQLEADMYQLPALASCVDEPAPPREGGRLAESQARWKRALRTQGYGMFPVTAAWKVVMSVSEFELGPQETRQINISITPAGGVFTGLQPFNIHGFATPPNGTRTLAGGVTLYVQGT
jgi:hypothetical protein